MDADHGHTSFDTIVIGGGQAGLAAGHYLARQGTSFLILDAHERTGDAWRRRWDSLRLFTPARYNGLPGMRFPGTGGAFITKDEMADYLEDYAERFRLPIRHGCRVERLSRRGERFVVSAGGADLIADNVIVAMSNFQAPHIPAFADQLGPSIHQLHVRDYRNPAQLRDGGVLVVGAGNSGAEVAMDLVQTRETWLAGETPGVVPFRIEPFVARNGLLRVVRFVGHHVLNVRTPVGRRARPQFLVQATPLIRVKPDDLVDAGVRRGPRMVGVREGQPLLADGSSPDVQNVIWCTGWRPGFSWIDLPVLGDRQEPAHQRGILEQEPGLYFVGLEFLTAATSATVTGVPRDAKRIARAVAARSKGAPRPSSRVPRTASASQPGSTEMR